MHLVLLAERLAHGEPRKIFLSPTLSESNFILDFCHIKSTRGTYICMEAGDSVRRKDPASLISLSVALAFVVGVLAHADKISRAEGAENHRGEPAKLG